MPSHTSASANNGMPSQYDIVRMAAYAAGQKDTYENLLTQLTQYALHSPVTERPGSWEIADYLWQIIDEWKAKRPR